MNISERKQRYFEFVLDVPENKFNVNDLELRWLQDIVGCSGSNINECWREVIASQSYHQWLVANTADYGGTAYMNVGELESLLYFDTSNSERRYFLTFNPDPSDQEHITLPSYGTHSEQRIECLFAQFTPSSSVQGIVGRHSSNRFYLATQNGNLLAAVGGGVLSIPTSPVADGKLHHASLEIVGPNAVVTLDNIEIFNGAASWSGAMSNIGIGAQITPVTNYYNGIIANACIFASGVLVGEYNLDSDLYPSNIVSDTSGNGNDGTAVNIDPPDTALFILDNTVTPNVWRKADFSLNMPIA